MVMSAGKISIHLGKPDVSFRDFAEAIEEQMTIVSEVLAEMGVPASAVRWVIDELHTGSAGGTFRAEVATKKASEERVLAGIQAAGAGVEQLNRGAARPRYFNDRALHAARRLSELVRHADPVRSWIRFESVSITPTAHIEANVDEIVEPRDESIGSIEGELLGVRKVRHGYTIYVKDRLSGHDVLCKISASLIPRAVQAFEKRVIVRGIVRAMADGTPKQIDVRDIEEMRGDTDLPSISQVGGLLRGYRLDDE